MCPLEHGRLFYSSPAMISDLPIVSGKRLVLGLCSFVTLLPPHASIISAFARSIYSVCFFPTSYRLILRSYQRVALCATDELPPCLSLPYVVPSFFFRQLVFPKLLISLLP